MSKGFASSYRIVLLAVGIVACFGALGTRLVFLHVLDRDKYVPAIDKARRQIIVQNARRGDILDSHDRILATSRSLIVLGVDPQALRPEDEKKWPQLAALIDLPLPQLAHIFYTKTRPAAGTPAAKAEGTNPLFSLKPSTPAPAAVAANDTKAEAAAKPGDDDDDTQVDDTPNENGERPIRWAKLREDLSESTYAEVQKLDIKGVYGGRVYRRAYPHNSLAAHLIGYVNKAGAPVAGLEHYADFFLRGRDGWREGERDGKGREVAQFRTRDVPPADGYTVALSLDSTIQHIAEEEIDYIVKKYQPLKATIIVSDLRAAREPHDPRHPGPGFILALANYPTFDPNEYNKIPKDEQGAMRNIAVADMYEPGSCFKIVAASGALNEHLVTPASTFDCSIDKIDYKGKTRGLPREDHHFGTLSVAEIIAHSSNRGAAQLAMQLGDERFYDYARGFGFGQLTGFPIGGEIDGSMAPPAKWDGLTITRMPMGQSVAATPLQMHMAMSVVASGGLLLRPQIIKEIRDAAGEPVYRYDTVVKRRVIDEATAHTMARLLMGVASTEGTAPEAAIPNYEVAGKTGTTQKIVDGHYSTTHHVASFIGFFPASRPQVAISVIVDDADAHAVGGVAYGKGVAAPSFKHIGEQLIQYMDIKPVYDTTGTTNLVMGGVSR
jgi:cell division protein FtsI/penicillin-binding protein 2